MPDSVAPTGSDQLTLDDVTEDRIEQAASEVGDEIYVTEVAKEVDDVVIDPNHIPDGDDLADVTAAASSSSSSEVMQHQPRSRLVNTSEIRLHKTGEKFKVFFVNFFFKLLFKKKSFCFLFCFFRLFQFFGVLLVF